MSSKLLITLGVGLSGSIAAEWMNLPLPWLLGSIFAVALFQVACSSAIISVQLRQIGQLIIGVAIGLYFTRQVASSLIGDLPLMILVAVLSISLAGIIGVLVSRFTLIDRTTSYFATMPGGVSEMSVLAERFGGNSGIVAFGQSLRLVGVVFIIPIGLALFVALPESLGRERGVYQGDHRLFLLGMLLLVALANSILFQKLKVMNSWFIGGLFAGGIFAFNEVDSSLFPIRLTDLGQLFIGAALGTRFHRTVLRALNRYIPILMLGTLLLITGSFIVALALDQLLDRSLPTLLLATAPGGVAEMSITAQTLRVDVAAVTAFHLVRIFLIVTFSAPIFRYVVRQRPK